MTTVSERYSRQATDWMKKTPKPKLQECLISIKQWMDETRLKMNPSKTEFIYFGNAKQLQKCTANSINVAGDLIVRSEVIRYLGVWLNSTLNFKTHVTKKCKVAMLNFIRIRSIHHLLTEDATSSLVLSLCISQLDCCNSVLYGLLDITINKMQKIQNICACLVLRKHKWDSTTACLTTLQWLPVKQCITFKICVLMYKLLHKQGPQCLQDMLQYGTPNRRLRSALDDSLLIIPRIKLKIFANRSFSVAAPTTWNALPKHIRNIPDLLNFKHALKTHLYQEAFT